MNDDIFKEESKLIDELIAIRKNSGISQKDLANVVDMQQQTISRIENKNHSPSLKSFLNLSIALGYNLKLEKTIEKPD